MWPTRKQWSSWSLPSRLTAVGTLVGILSLIVMLALEIVKYCNEFQKQPNQIIISDYGVGKSDTNDLIRLLNIRAMMVNRELETLKKELNGDLVQFQDNQRHQEITTSLIKRTNDLEEQFNDLYEMLIDALSKEKFVLAHETLGEIHGMGTKLFIEEKRYKEAAERMSSMMISSYDGILSHTISAWPNTIHGFMNGIEFNAANK